MLKTTFKEFMVILKNLKEEMEENIDELPDDDEELNFNDWD